MTQYYELENNDKFYTYAHISVKKDSLISINGNKNVH